MTSQRFRRFASDQFSIVARDAAVDDRKRVLKHGDTCAICAADGDLVPGGLGEHGLYHLGTRYLSSLRLRVFGHDPMLMSSTISADNLLMVVELTNPDLYGQGEVIVPRGTIYLKRSRFLWNACWYEQILVSNFALESVVVEVTLDFGADFADIFEVRGMRRPQRGDVLLPATNGAEAVLAYRGLDEVQRTTRLTFTPAPAHLSGESAGFDLYLAPRESTTIELVVACEQQEERPARVAFDHALVRARRHLAERAGGASVVTSHEQFNEWLCRSIADVRTMTTDTPYGPYPYAGVPWFNTPFGRDGIITALETLWLDPQLAQGVLRYLAATQATAVLPDQEAEPGKILHEARFGEMAALGEVPFRQYYGSVDATPLFVMLAGAYYRHTGDLVLIRELWLHIRSAIDWVDRYGDVDGDGFVEYVQHSPTGLLNQGWKDSYDAVFHSDGELAKGPIALCEVQGYAYAAKLAAADLADALGYRDGARRYRAEAAELAKRFDRAFWSDELGTYALALDGAKRRCDVATSNPGHCLYTGIVPPRRLPQVARRLMEPDLFCGWGVRTVSSLAARYNPMSYHNGSVWPHDNAIIGAALGQAGYKQAALQLLEGMFLASLQSELRRLPELFCGFEKTEDSTLAAYPTACSPQAWASAAPFLLLAGCLGLSVDAPAGRLTLNQPRLPECLEWLEVRDLQVGPASLDLRLLRHADDVSVNVLRRRGPVEVLVRK